MSRCGGCVTSCECLLIGSTLVTVTGTGSVDTPYVISTSAVGTTDSRLSNARTPLAHAATHLSAGTDAIDWGNILGVGLFSAIPVAGANNANYYYIATDKGWLLQSTGGAWVVRLYTNDQHALTAGESVLRRSSAADTLAPGASNSTAWFTYFTAIHSETITQAKVPVTVPQSGATIPNFHVGVYSVNSVSGALALLGQVNAATGLAAVTSPGLLTVTFGTSFVKTRGLRYALVVSAPAMTGGGTYPSFGASKISALDSALAPKTAGIYTLTTLTTLPSTLVDADIVADPATWYTYAPQAHLLP